MPSGYSGNGMDEMAGVAEKAAVKSAQKTTKESAKEAAKPSAKLNVKVFDISKPNKQPASATSRPVITRSGPLMQDPMMSSGMSSGISAGMSGGVPNVLAADASTASSDHEPGNSSASETETSPSKVKLTLQPLSENTENTVQGDTAAEPVVSAEPEKLAEPAKTPEGSDSPAANDLAADQNPDETVAVQTKTQEGVTKRLAELSALAESEEYFLPINSVERHRSKIVALLGVIVILALGLLLVNLMLDAGFIRIPGVQPLTHIFSV